MDELKKIKKAKLYIDEMANGVNPINGISALPTDTINNIEISRCLFYVSNILSQIIENKGKYKTEKTYKIKFFISDDKLKDFAFSDSPIVISEITNRLNDLADLNICKKLKATDITSWLVEIGVLEIQNAISGKTYKIPTQQGKKLGLTTEIRFGHAGEYTVVIYSREAQQFIIDNIEAIIATT